MIAIVVNGAIIGAFGGVFWEDLRDIMKFKHE